MIKTFIKEQDLLPSHYNKVTEPIFKGKGNHSINELEKLLEQYKEFAHQLQIREQNILKFTNAKIVNCNGNCGSNYCDEYGCVERKSNFVNNNLTETNE